MIKFRTGVIIALAGVAIMMSALLVGIHLLKTSEMGTADLWFWRIFYTGISTSLAGICVMSYVYWRDHPK